MPPQPQNHCQLARHYLWLSAVALATIAWMLHHSVQPGASCSFLPSPAPVCCPAQNFGGNIDNRRIGKGATMYYPVQVQAQLSTSAVLDASVLTQSATTKPTLCGFFRCAPREAVTYTPHTCCPYLTLLAPVNDLQADRPVQTVNR
jgi:hypothetical protein